MFDADRSNKIEASELEYVLILVFKKKPDKGMIEDCMRQFDVDSKLEIYFIVLVHQAKISNMRNMYT